MLPDVFGWADVFAGRPKLAAWWRALQDDPAAARVSCRSACATQRTAAHCVGAAHP
jgi:hypothetical protein